MSSELLAEEDQDVDIEDAAAQEDDGGEEEEEEEEETAELEEIVQARKVGEIPKIRIVHDRLLEDYSRRAVPKERRLLTPFLSRYELSKILEFRRDELSAMTEAELREGAGIPKEVLEDLAVKENNKALSYLRGQLVQKLELPRRLTFDDLSETAGVTIGSLLPAMPAPPARQRLKDEIAVLKQAIKKIRQGRLYDPLAVARAEWQWRRIVGYGIPYFISRDRPDGNFEVWELWELNPLG